MFGCAGKEAGGVLRATIVIVMHVSFSFGLVLALLCALFLLLIGWYELSISPFTHQISNTIISVPPVSPNNYYPFTHPHQPFLPTIENTQLRI